jgi:hypothetical protein
MTPPRRVQVTGDWFHPGVPTRLCDKSRLGPFGTPPLTR